MMQPALRPSPAPVARPPSAKANPRPHPYSAFSSLSKSLLATGVLLAFIMIVLCGGGMVASPFAFHHGDDLSESQIQERQAAFNALAPMQLALVSADQMSAAINSMGLPPIARRAVMIDLARSRHIPSVPAPTADQSSAPISGPSPQPNPELAPDSNRLRLAWISLWDTDVEDGDTVQIESEGYARTIVLKHEAVTLAVPVPADGIVHVRGVRDGDGGGITVGLASGASVAVFPIMSEGQLLGLKVSR